MAHWYKKWKIKDTALSYIVDPTLVQDKLQKIYKSESEIIKIRMLDKLVGSAVNFGYVLIEFADGRFGEVALLAHKRQIRLFPDPLASINNTGQENEQETPAEPDSPLNILNMLNDDCLKEIFERLPLGDLCSVADTCKTFRRNAEEIFSVQFAKLKNEIKWLKFWQVESLFRNFGNLITEFAYDFDKFHEEKRTNSIFNNGFHHNVVMLLLISYCSGVSCPLTNLKIHEVSETRLETQVMNLDPVWDDSLKPIFGRLNCLHLDRCNVSGSLLSICSEITDLRLVYPHEEAVSALTTSTFSKLEKLTLRLFHQSLSVTLNGMKSNSNLKSLLVGERPNDTYYVTFIETIGSKFPNLEELIYIADPFDPALSFVDAEGFQQFKCLKSLKFENAVCDMRLINQLVATQSQLESLNFGYILLDTERNSKEFVKKISELTHLEELSIFGELFDYDQLKTDLATALPSLQRFQVRNEDQEIAEIRSVREFFQIFEF